MVKESPLATIHRRNGAQFVELNGWGLPSSFGDPLAEYQAVRDGLGLVDHSYRAVLRFHGPDRVSFLQGMISNDVKLLADGQGMAAAFLDVQGKILADARVLCAPDALFVDLWAFLKEKIIAHLNRYLIADEVEIDDLSEAWTILSIRGPKTRSLLSGLFADADLSAENHGHRAFTVDGKELRLIRADSAGCEGCDLLAETAHLISLLDRIEDLRRRFAGRWVGTEAQEILRIEAGIPSYGADMNEENLLLETGLDHAVSFRKGCYLGQEVVERIRSRGHVNRKLAGIILIGNTAAAPRAALLVGDKEIGNVTSSTFSPLLKRPIALGYVHRDWLNPGTQVLVRHKDETIPAEIASLPFTGPAQSPRDP